MTERMVEYSDDATSLLSLVPLWNPSDEACWRERMEMGEDVLESCLRMYRAGVTDLATASFRTKVQAYLSAVAAYHLEIAECFHEFHRLGGRQGVEDDVLHERYAILIMKSHLTLEDFLAAGQEGALAVERRVTNQLDAIASTLVDRMDSANVLLTDRVSVVSLLMTIAFDELGFIVSGERSNCYKEMILSHVLRENTGCDLAIALLLKFVCKRVGIQVDVIRSCGTFLGVSPETPEEPHEIIFNMKAQQLSPQECQELTSQYDRKRSSPLFQITLSVLDIRVLCQFAIEGSLLKRNNNLWSPLVLGFSQPSDRSEITYI